ncbi:hypothetical protein G7043_28290 [Lentzea sp. NEAU-D13]|uniref:Uncharacterized protein n=1 Tax=Lentzea alba TaxID=2714351 RepID=A0A7C9RU13_9PSEU|nr:hypothetical protein [Lentzea alba]NGY62824.1 hypothetical protein [Lentzea alba]
MYPTVTVEHLASVSATDASDDLKIYEFDRETTVDFGSGWSATMPGGRSFVRYEEVLAA